MRKKRFIFVYKSDYREGKEKARFFSYPERKGQDYYKADKDFCEWGWSTLVKRIGEKNRFIFEYDQTQNSPLRPDGLSCSLPLRSVAPFIDSRQDIIAIILEWIHFDQVKLLIAFLQQERSGPGGSGKGRKER